MSIDSLQNDFFSDSNHNFCIGRFLDDSFCGIVNSKMFFTNGYTCEEIGLYKTYHDAFGAIQPMDTKGVDTVLRCQDIVYAVYIGYYNGDTYTAYKGNGVHSFKRACLISRGVIESAKENRLQFEYPRIPNSIHTNFELIENYRRLSDENQ